MLDQSFLGEKYYDISNVAEQFAPGGTLAQRKPTVILQNIKNHHHCKLSKIIIIANFQKSLSLQFIKIFAYHVVEFFSCANKDRENHHHDHNLEYDDAKRRR